MKRQFGLFSFSLFLMAIIIFQSCTKLERIDPTCPTIGSLNPDAARVDDIVTITGNDFVVGKPGLYTVTIDGTTVPVTEVPDANTMKFKVPLGKSGPLKVNLTISPHCSSNTLNFTYHYTPLRVEKLTGTPMSTSCPNVSANCLASPIGIDLDNQGNLIVADKDNFVIRKINVSTGAIEASYGTFKPMTLNCDAATIPNSTTATLNYPYDVDVDPSGDIYFVEEFNRTLRVLRPGNTPDVTPVFLVGGSCSGASGTCASSAMSAPYGLSKDNNSICYIDNGNIKMMDLAGSSCSNVTSVLSHGPNQYFRGIELSNARPGQGPVFIADELEKNIKMSNLQGTATVLQTEPTGSFTLNQPVALTLDSKGNIFIADKGADRIFVLYTNGDLDVLAGTSEGYADNIDALQAKFKNPAGLALNEEAGILYVADTGNNLIRKVTFK